MVVLRDFTSLFHLFVTHVLCNPRLSLLDYYMYPGIHNNN
jgi:hypothetical protein